MAPGSNVGSGSTTVTSMIDFEPFKNDEEALDWIEKAQSDLWEPMEKVSDATLKELAKLQDWPRSIALELITAREHIPAINAECKRLYEENLVLKANLRTYLEQLVKKIDEKREK